VRRPQSSALNGCDLRKHPSVIVVRRDARRGLPPGFDRIERVRSGFPQVNFAGILIRMGSAAGREDGSTGWLALPDRVRPRRAADERLWIGVCRRRWFATQGGKVLVTKLGKADEAQLRAEIRRIL
jgi:hypothetical protein